MSPLLIQKNAQLLWDNTLDYQIHFEVDSKDQLYVPEHWPTWMKLKSCFVSPDPDNSVKTLDCVYETLDCLDKLLEQGRRPFVNDGEGWKFLYLNYSPYYPANYLAERIKGHPQFKNVDRIIKMADRIINKKDYYPIHFANKEIIPPLRLGETRTPTIDPRIETDEYVDVAIEFEITHAPKLCKPTVVTFNTKDQGTKAALRKTL